MTVHRSKGLEFPVVFVAGTSHQFNTADTRNAVLFHRKLGIGLTLRSPQRHQPVPDTALCGHCRRPSAPRPLSEEMRILYVALTRAQGRAFHHCAAEKYHQ